MITSSAWRNSSQAATGGVGLIISRDAESNLCEVSSISKRIIQATFSGNPPTTIIVACAPTNAQHSSNENTAFYQDLRRAIDNVPPHNVLMILGDMNAKLSSNHMKHNVHTRTNENGILLGELIHEKSLFIANDKFQKKLGKRWTFEDPKNNRHLLDYILVNTKWRNSVTNAEAYSSFDSVGSDHRIVTMDFRLSLRVTKPPSTNIRYDWKCLKNNPATLNNFSLELRNKFNQLYNENDDINTQYGALIEANKYAAKQTLPVNKSTKNDPLSKNPIIAQARKRVNILSKKYNISRTRLMRKQLQTARKSLQEEYLKLESDQIENQLAQAEVAFHANNTNNAWKLVNTITNRKTTATCKLKGKTPEERTQQWYQHFKSLLGTPAEISNPIAIPSEPIFSNINISDKPFTIKEIITRENR